MSASPAHWKRPHEKQNRPIRRPFAVPRPAAAPTDSKGAASAPGVAVCELLENGVRTAYAVIDEYLRRGQEVARGVFNDSNRGGNMSDCRGNYPAGYPPSGGYGPVGYGPGFGFYGIWTPMALMAEQWINALRAWNYMWCGYPPAPVWQGPWTPQGPQAGAPNMGSYAATQTARPEAVILNINSSSPVECSANLPAGVFPQTLCCDPLVLDGSSTTVGVASGAKGSTSVTTTEPIRTVSIICNPGSVQITVTVPYDQAQGIYRGLIKRVSDQSAVGNLVVKVMAKQP